MTEKMKTVCVGRYPVDVPIQAAVGTSHARESDAKAAEALLAQLSLRAENEIPTTPGLHLELPGHPDLHEDALLSLCDSIASGIRLRPPPPPA